MVVLCHELINQFHIFRRIEQGFDGSNIKTFNVLLPLLFCNWNGCYVLFIKWKQEFFHDFNAMAIIKTNFKVWDLCRIVNTDFANINSLVDSILT